MCSHAACIKNLDCDVLLFDVKNDFCSRWFFVVFLVRVYLFSKLELPFVCATLSLRMCLYGYCDPNVLCCCLTCSSGDVKPHPAVCRQSTDSPSEEMERHFVSDVMKPPQKAHLGEFL